MSRELQVNIPSNPEDLDKIRRVLETISISMSRIEAEKDLIKDEIEALSEKYKIPKKFLNRMARIYHRQNFNEVVEEQNDFETLYESVMSTS